MCVCEGRCIPVCRLTASALCSRSFNEESSSQYNSWPLGLIAAAERPLIPSVLGIEQYKYNVDNNFTEIMKGQ